MDIDDLLAAPELRLLERTPPDVPRRPVSWVATTELDDIARFLRGGEVVLTTLLPTRGDAELVTFVTSLAEVGAAALCIGTGHVRHEIPPAVIEAATRVGLPILESSAEVPFVQISRWVADRIYADQYRIVREHARHQSELLGALHGPDPLGNVVGVLRKVLDAPVVLRDVTGQVIEARPRGAGSESSWTSVPVRVRSGSGRTCRSRPSSTVRSRSSSGPRPSGRSSACSSARSSAAPSWPCTPPRARASACRR